MSTIEITSMKKQLIDINPSSISLEEAYCMCSHMREYAPPESEYKQTSSLTYESDEFPLVIDFDDFRKIVPPKGYEVVEPCRNITVKISTFAGYCAAAKHYYCDLKFNGPMLRNKKDGFVYSFGKPVGCGVGDIFGFHKIELYRRLTEKDLSDKNIDWDYYDVGDMTHRWNNMKNAVACAKKVIKLRFRNYGDIIVSNDR